MTARTRLPFFAMLAIVLMAGLFRWHMLGAQSLWYDEGASFGQSQRGVLDVVANVRNNVHMPLYFVSLALWEDLTGSSEFSLRALSVLFSLVSLSFSYAIGRRLYGAWVGVLTGALVALNSFSISYAQEARMYAMLAAWAGWSMYALVAFIQARDTAQQQRHALSLALANTLGAYTHISYAFVMLAQGVLMAGYFLQQMLSARRVTPSLGREVLLYWLANIATIIAIIPFAGNLLTNAESQPNLTAPISLAELISVLLGWLAVGNTYPAHIGGMSIVLVFFLLFGLIIPPKLAGRRGIAWGLALPVLWVLVSCAAYVYLGFYERYLRFLLPAQLGMALWLARGAWVLWHWRTRDKTPPLMYVPRFAALFASFALLYSMAGGLWHVYHDPAFQRADWRGLAQHIAQRATPQDAVIVAPSGLNDIFGYYYRQAQASADLSPLPQDKTRLLDDLQALMAGHQDVYAVYYGVEEHDPDNLIRRTLGAELFPVQEIWWDDMRFAHYARAELGKALPIDARFGEQIVLASAALSATPQAGGVLALELLWQAQADIGQSYAVFVQVLNAEGVLVAQRDSMPQDGFAPTHTWRAGQSIRDRHALALVGRDALPLPRGEYRLIMGLYDPNTGRRLLLADGAEYVELGRWQF